ncbi:SH3 domain-containing protein [Alkalibacterium subtropicum]|uniref:SH3 domain-containing protein n=1 Tax=Alkalibacterium subtropicum TaxID=753702 RepID=A0A1I1LFJ4_9LACT|nr:M15 family metallopeptidase [Alkalibacterium subtropicum]SFC69123.1 SH3 domain-containing protein [Alkalibacterium subtropicum]
MKKQKPFLNGLLIILLFSIVIVSIVLYLERSPAQDQSGRENEAPSGQTGDGESTEGANSEEKPELPVWYMEGSFELPVIGAAGYTSVNQTLYKDPDVDAKVIRELKPGTPFKIKGEAGDYWQVEADSFEGWIEHRFAFINLPDVVPSIIYDHTNSYDSRFKTSYMDIPELTGEPLNPMIDYNERLEEEEYVMPILYQTAKKVFHAQQLALQNGDTLVVYETFRPRELQLLVNEEMEKLAEENEEVAAGITEKPWSLTWFINMKVSNHQRGMAIDLSLAKVEELTDQTIGDFKALKVQEYTEYTMHTPIHELSVESAVFNRPIASADREGWKELAVNPKMAEPALKLQSYMVEAGFNPLASEWWHFNDVDALEDLEKAAGNGKFLIKETVNRAPFWEDITPAQ